MDRKAYLQIRSQLEFVVNPKTWFWEIGINLFLVAVAGASAGLGLWGSCLASLLLAAVYFRAFSGMHEAVHGLLHPSRRTNDYLGVVFGAFCFLPFNQWKDGHLQHHFWAGNVTKDPVMKLCLFVKNGGRLHWIINLCWRLWFPILAILQELVFWYLCIQLFKAKRNRLDLMSMIAPLLLWASVFAGFGAWTFLTVIVPSIVIYLVFIEIVNFPHHLELPQFDGDKKITVGDQHLISRSCTYPRWVERGLLLNFNYHVEHHLFPTLPFQQLYRAHQLIRSELKEAYNIDAGLSWIVRNRKRSLDAVLYSPPPIISVEPTPFPVPNRAAA